MKPKLHAMISHPRQGEWTVELYYRIDGRSVVSMLAVTIPAHSYDHAKAIAEAVNQPKESEQVVDDRGECAENIATWNRD